MRSRKSRLALAALTFGVLAVPASANAATLSITGDDGVPQALSGQTIRNMSPQLAVGINGTTERSYTVQVIGPNGDLGRLGDLPELADAAHRQLPGQRRLHRLRRDLHDAALHRHADDGSLTFAIGAGVAIATDPNTPLLTRQPGEFATIEHRLPVTGNPGADTYDVLYSGNPALAPDGGLVGPSQNAYVDAATATVPIRFSEPGSYSVVARARVYGGAATPWTAPLALRVYAPFDFSTSSFPDSRGPSYRLRVRLREEDTRGRVRISVAKRWSGNAKYRTLGTVRIRGRVLHEALHALEPRHVPHPVPVPGLVDHGARHGRGEGPHPQDRAVLVGRHGRPRADLRAGDAEGPAGSLRPAPTRSLGPRADRRVLREERRELLDVVRPVRLLVVDAVAGARDADDRDVRVRRLHPLLVLGLEGRLDARGEHAGRARRPVHRRRSRPSVLLSAALVRTSGSMTRCACARASMPSAIMRSPIVMPSPIGAAASRAAAASSSSPSSRIAIALSRMTGNMAAAGLFACSAGSPM